MAVRYFLLLLPFLAISKLNAQIQSGPMLGFVDMMEANIWLQSAMPADVKIVYWKADEPGVVYGTPTITTVAGNALTAQFKIGPIEPGTNYGYEVWANETKVSFPYPLTFKTQEIWKWRGDAPNFSFAFGSCFYVNEPAYDRPGKPYGQNFGILEQIKKQNPDFMIWGGDNVYYREVDYNSTSGMNHRYTHTRSLPALQPLLAAMPHYAIWDDHDYGPNDSDRSYPLKREALEIFKNFWINPNYVFENQGVTGSFTYADCQFFLLDDRWWRSPNERKKTGDRVYFGEDQLTWLIDALSYSEATFKFIVSGGQILNPVPVVENYSNFPEERARLLDLIEKEDIKGVIFLTGDRHHSSLTKIDRPDTYPLYDLTISPLSAGAGAQKPVEKWAPFVEGTSVERTQNFSTLSISGTNGNRILKIKVFDYTGKQLWEREIKEGELR
ncbi:MAG: alkaline phosphatase family protein [Saprospiraceae bacterium]|nr:alkaline phosphatase family protein [Saprospiraceae bacterium]